MNRYGLTVLVSAGRPCWHRLPRANDKADRAASANESSARLRRSPVQRWERLRSQQNLSAVRAEQVLVTAAQVLATAAHAHQQAEPSHCSKFQNSSSSTSRLFGPWKPHILTPT